MGLVTGKSLREKRTKLVKLPSLTGDDRVLLRRPNLLEFVKVSPDGQPLDFISGIVLDGIKRSQENGGEKVEIRLPQMDVKTITDWRAAMDTVCRLAFVNPKIVDNPSADDEIAIWDIDDTDKSFVLKWVLGGNGAAAATFPEEPNAGMVSLPAGEGVQPNTSETSGN